MIIIRTSLFMLFLIIIMSSDPSCQSTSLSVPPLKQPEYMDLLPYNIHQSLGVN